MNAIDESACEGIGTASRPCAISAPEDFDFGTNTSKNYFQWKSGYFKINTLEPFDITLSDAGYATYYNEEYDIELPNGLKASVVTNASNLKLTYKVIADGAKNQIIPANVAVLLEGERRSADTYTLTPLEASASYTGKNLLYGSDETTTTSANESNCLFYKLTYGPSGTDLSNTFGWFWGGDNGKPFTIEGHKAWLAIPKASSAKTRAIFYPIDGSAIQLEITEGQDNEDTGYYYDLQGRRIGKEGERPKQPGIYIHNGEKIYVK